MRVYIKPKNDKRPVYPRSSRLLPVEGAEVELSIYWQRRLKDGDVEVTNPPKPRAERAKRGTSAREGD